MVSPHSKRTVKKTGSAAQMSVACAYRSSGPETGNWMWEHEDELDMSDWSGVVGMELRWKMFGKKQDKSKLDDFSGKDRSLLLPK